MASKFVQKCVSTYNSLNRNDWLNGLIMAAGMAFLTSLGQGIENLWNPQSLAFDFSKLRWPTHAEWFIAFKTGGGAGLFYIVRKWKSGPKAPAVTQ